MMLSHTLQSFLNFLEFDFCWQNNENINSSNNDILLERANRKQHAFEMPNTGETLDIYCKYYFRYLTPFNLL